MRLSRYFLPVLKENPAEAQIVSHRYMLRAGMIKQQAAGIYSWLPLGYRVLKRIEQLRADESPLWHLTRIDPAARELTAEAARAAGYGAVTLLEEPQSALYSWIQTSQGAWRKAVKPGDVVRVRLDAADIATGAVRFSLVS